MFAFIRRVLGFSPSSVDGALCIVTKALKHLRDLADAKQLEATVHAASVEMATAAHAAATQEAERADRVHGAISKLVA